MSLADTIARISNYKITKVNDLMPWRWNRSGQAGRFTRKTFTPEGIMLSAPHARSGAA